MSNRIRFRRPGAATVVSLVALFVALGGTSYATVATMLPRNSVGSAQVVNGSLQTVDLSQQAKSALKGARGPAGAAGLEGPIGATGAQGLKGDTGAQGLKGNTGAQGPKGDTGAQGSPGPPGPPGPFVDVEPWHEIGAPGEPSFEHGWQNYNVGSGWETAAYYKDPWGRVYMRGLIGGGTLDAIAFRLPEGYRPAQAPHFVGSSNFQAADAINVYPDGGVYIRGAASGVSPVWVSLANVNFRAEK
jgi:Collagen triple helix repeat (20 copies)